MILCCGEALVEMHPHAGAGRDGDDAHAAPLFAAHPGGTAVGTAVALGRLGVPAGFLGGLSTDSFGALLAAQLAAAHVDTRLAPRSDRPTTLAFPAPGGGVSLRDGATAGRMLEDAALPDLPPQVTALAFGGVHLAAEPCGSAFEALAARAHPRRVVLLDPNIRPGLIADARAFRARLERMIACADILKLSDADLAWLRGPAETPDALAAQIAGLRAAGPALVVLTHGARGATGYGPASAPDAGAPNGAPGAAPSASPGRPHNAPEGAIFVPAPSVTVADRLGAGETFTAGLLAALHRAGHLTRTGLTQLPVAALRSALNLGVHAAAVTVSRRGPNPPFARELA